jgi:hypothetical protein
MTTYLAWLGLGSQRCFPVFPGPPILLSTSKPVNIPYFCVSGRTNLVSGCVHVQRCFARWHLHLSCVARVQAICTIALLLVDTLPCLVLHVRTALWRSGSSTGSRPAGLSLCPAPACRCCAGLCVFCGCEWRAALSVRMTR